MCAGRRQESASRRHGWRRTVLRTPLESRGWRRRDRAACSGAALVGRDAPGRGQGWGEALLGELDAVPREDQTRWALALVALSLARLTGRLRREGGRRFVTKRALRAGLSIGFAVGAMVAGELSYANLGPASRDPASDALASVLAAYTLLGALFVAIGFVSKGRGEQPRSAWAPR